MSSHDLWTKPLAKSRMTAQNVFIVLHVSLKIGTFLKTTHRKLSLYGIFYDLTKILISNFLIWYHILPPYQKKCPLSFWYKNSPFSKILFSGLVKPKKLSLVSLERVESWLSNDTKFNFFGPMRPAILEKGEFLYQKETGQVLWNGGSNQYSPLGL